MMYDEYTFKYSLKNHTKHSIKVGDVVEYKGQICKVVRVDKHVYPIVLKEIGRVSLDDIRCHTQESKQ